MVIVAGKELSRADGASPRLARITIAAWNHRWNDHRSSEQVLEVIDCVNDTTGDLVSQ